MTTPLSEPTTASGFICEADRRNKQALYAIHLARGTGVIDLGRIAALLEGDVPCEGGSRP